MTETIITADAPVEGVVEKAEDNTAEPAAPVEDSSKESDAAGEGATEEEVTKDDEDEEPPVRKPRTNADWVAKRRADKIKKLKDSGDDQQGEDDEDSEEEDDVDDEDAKIIDKRIAKQLAPLREKEYQAEVKAEIDTFVSENPDFKPFAAKAAKWAQHPDWKNIPTKQLMHAAAGDKLLAMGAKRKELAQQKANLTKTGTHTGGESGGKKPVADMSDEEFNAEIIRVKTQGRN